MVAYAGYEGAMGILKPMQNVTYIFTFPNLDEIEPVDWDIPPGANMDPVMDFCLRAQGDLASLAQIGLGSQSLLARFCLTGAHLDCGWGSGSNR